MLGLALCGAAHAGLYKFVDANGVANYTNVPPDHRYRPIGGRETDAAQSAPVSFAYRAAERQRYAGAVLAASHASNVEPALIHAVISAESGYNPYARSNRGAVGLMQLMPETAVRYGVTNRLDPGQNIRAGTRYLRDLLALFHNNVQLALAAYNAGEQAVIRYGNRIPPFRETKEYVPRVMSYYRAYRGAPT